MKEPKKNREHVIITKGGISVNDDTSENETDEGEEISIVDDENINTPQNPIYPKDNIKDKELIVGNGGTQRDTDVVKQIFIIDNKNDEVIYSDDETVR